MIAQLKLLDRHLQAVESNLESKIESKIATVYWVIGIVGGAVTVLLALLNFKK